MRGFDGHREIGQVDTQLIISIEQLKGAYEELSKQQEALRILKAQRVRKLSEYIEQGNSEERKNAEDEIRELNQKEQEIEEEKIAKIKELDDWVI